MSSGQVLKAEKDFTKEVDKLIPEAEKLAAVCMRNKMDVFRLTYLFQSNVQAAIEKLLLLEKQTRQVGHL